MNELKNKNEILDIYEVFIFIGTNDSLDEATSYIGRNFDYIFGSVIESYIDLLLLNPTKTLILCQNNNIFNTREDIIELYNSGFKNVIDCLTIKYNDSFDNDIISKNIKKFTSAINLIEDKKSKDIYQSVIKYRLTKDIVFLKESDFYQYEHPLVKIQKGDTFLDIGSCNGKNILQFYHLVEGDCNIFAFEPAHDNFNIAKSLIEENNVQNNCKIFELAMSDKIGSAKISSSFGSDATIIDNGDITIKTDTLDNFLPKNDIIPDIIKADIEGHEISLLLGAKKTILKYQPKLQICLYHHLHHLCDIPLLINSIVSGYSFYVGHHSSIFSETVLYAINIEKEMNTIKEQIKNKKYVLAMERLTSLLEVEPAYKRGNYLYLLDYCYKQDKKYKLNGKY